jgi:hypothetical protein
MSTQYNINKISRFVSHIIIISMRIGSVNLKHSNTALMFINRDFLF